jgi:transposase
MRPPLRIINVHWRQKARLQEMYVETSCPRTRIRVQMVLLAIQGLRVSEITEVTYQSDDTVRRWLHRFLERGCSGLLEELHPGRPADITPAIENFLVECLKRSPRKRGVQRPTWTTATLASQVEKKFGVVVSDESIRQHLQRLEIVCRRPTWTVKHLAKQQPGYVQKKARLQGF